MFVELKKPFLGRAAGERIDVSRGRRPPARPAGHGRRRRRRPHRPGRRPRPRRRPGPRRPDHRRGRQPVAQGLRRRPDAGPQARRARSSSARAATAIRTARPSATGCLAVARNDRALPRKALRQPLQRVRRQGGPGRGQRRHRRLHRAARVLPAAHDHHGGGDLHPPARLRPADGRRPRCRSPTSTSPPCSRPASRRSSAACRCTGPPRPRRAPRRSRSSSRWS